MGTDGRSELHTSGRPGTPNSLQRSSSSSWTQRTPAGLPWGMSGMALLIDGAMQQAAQDERQFMDPVSRAGLAECPFRMTYPWALPTILVC